jgi:hypothetical protein
LSPAGSGAGAWKVTELQSRVAVSSTVPDADALMRRTISGSAAVASDTAAYTPTSTAFIVSLAPIAAGVASRL